MLSLFNDNVRVLVGVEIFLGKAMTVIGSIKFAKNSLTVEKFSHFLKIVLQ